MSDIQLRCTVPLPTQKVLAVAFSPDGSVLAAGDRDGVIHLLDPNTGNVLRKMKQKHVEFVYCLAFDPDSGRLISAGKDKSVREWNIADGSLVRDDAGIFMGGGARTMAAQNCRQAAKGHTMTVLSVCCEKGGLMATSGQDCKVKFWQNGEPVRTFDWHSAPVTCVRFQPNTHVLYSASKDKTIRSWNDVTGAVIHKYCAHLSDICALEFADEHTFFSVDTSGCVYAWHDDCEKPLSCIYCAPRHVMCAKYLKDGQTLILGCEDGALEVIPCANCLKNDTAAVSPLCTMRLHNAAVRCIDVIDKNRIASCDNAGNVILSSIV